MALNVYNPQTPYVGAIQGGLQTGMMVLVSGSPSGPQNRFSINLQGGYNNENGIAFHFNPRFGENQVVRNTHNAGSWGPEERNGPFPFRMNNHFDVAIQVQEHCYQVSVNGQHFCNYNHRIPVNQVTHLRVSDGVRIDSIRAESPFPRGYPVAGELVPMYNPPVPFRQHIGSLYPGRMIFISGIPKLNGSRFSIYVDCGHDTAFVFDARFAFGNDRYQVVRNTKQNNTWGHEERDIPYFPFQQDMFFDMIILVEAGCFKVAVNNQHFLAYNHRIQPVNRVDTLKIEGDVKLCHVRFQ